MDTTVKIDARDVNFWYGDFHALKGISMEIEEKSVVAFIGPSGCGKSTFLRLFNRMNDLIPATRLTGEIRIDGENIYDKGVQVDELRKNVGMVFQRPNPFPKSIFENVAYGLRVNGVKDNAFIRQRVEETLKMNTAIAQLMTLVNALYDNGGATKAELETVVQLLNPFAPHMTEELWEKLGHSHDEQLAYYPWPKYEEAKCVESTVEIAVQVNGKVKARLKVAADIDAAAAIAAAKADPAVAAALKGKQLVKEIYVKGRLVNLAVKG